MLWKRWQQERSGTLRQREWSMSDISFDLSGKIDQKTVEALAIMKRVALGLNISYTGEEHS